jgi:carboxyl-terminal processing protease
MSARSRLLVFLVSAPLVALVVVGGPLGAGASLPVPQQHIPQLGVFQDVLTYILRAYVEEVEIDRVMDGAMRGLADGLDPSSTFLTAEEVKAAQAGAAPPAGEVGLVVTRWGYYLRVLGVRDGSPADRAGFATNDFIRSIDDRPARDLSGLTATRLLRGQPGTKVVLVVFRGTNATDTHEIELVREAGRIDRAAGRRLPGGEAYLRISSFGAGAAAAIARSVSALGATARNGLIIDVRGTADGTAEEAIAAARHFVANGALATLASRGGAPVVTAATRGDGGLSMPLVVLTSNGTANGAEIFAAALQGNKRARLVGEPTAGLAGLQRLVPFEDGTGLWMTYARYMQQDGTPIHEQGLRPDLAVEITAITIFGDPPPSADEILEAGVAELKKLRRDGAAPTAAAGV